MVSANSETGVKREEHSAQHGPNHRETGRLCADGELLTNSETGTVRHATVTPSSLTVSSASVRLSAVSGL